MQIKIKTISLPLPLRMGRVNCYLIQTDAGYVLIDTGGSNNRQELVQELEKAGCMPGSLRLIVITHGDFDHTGNAAYLRQAFGSQIAMHADDVGMVEQADMFVNRKKPNLLIRMLLPLFSRFGRAERFTPDVLLRDGDILGAYELDARVISIPGHSLGSIAILTASSDLFCGDLLENTKSSSPGSIVDDASAMQASIDRVKGLGVLMVYPGHGRPFPMSELTTRGA